MVVATVSRKDEILARIVDYVFERGVSDLSLRPLAEELGTSARMLLYHFESKEQLLAEVLAAARARQYEMLADWLQEGASLPDLLRRYWEWAAADSSRPYMRLFFEVYGLAVQGRPGTEDVLPALFGQAVDLFREAALRSGVPTTESEELVRLSVSVLRGLLFDLLATGQRPVLDAALDRFLAFVESQLNVSRG